MNQQGVTLLLAIIFLTIALSITLGIFHVVLVQFELNRNAKDSHIAFFAGDTGLECALYYLNAQGAPDGHGYWNPSDVCLAGSDPCGGVYPCVCGQIACVDDPSVDVRALGRVSTGVGYETTLEFDFASDGLCSLVRIVTKLDGNPGDEYIKTEIESAGKSSCSSSEAVNRTVAACITSDPTQCSF